MQLAGSTSSTLRSSLQTTLFCLFVHTQFLEIEVAAARCQPEQLMVMLLTYGVSGTSIRCSSKGVAVKNYSRKLEKYTPSEGRCSADGDKHRNGGFLLRYNRQGRKVRYRETQRLGMYRQSETRSGAQSTESREQVQHENAKERAIQGPTTSLLHPTRWFPALVPDGLCISNHCFSVTHRNEAHNKRPKPGRNRKGTNTHRSSERNPTYGTPHPFIRSRFPAQARLASVPDNTASL